MIDAWRLGLLLYCQRVFHTDNVDKDKLRTLAEEIIWLIKEMPDGASIEKQCLVPLIFAGCEMESVRFRQIATDFCTRWNNLHGMWIFASAQTLLASVWSAIDAGDADCWWGSKIAKNTAEHYIFG